MGESMTARSRVAVVTGSAHGIGTAIVDGLRADGVIVHGIDKDSVDVTDTEAIASFMASLGPVDILVNNAGGVVGQSHRPIEEISDGDWSAILDANLTSTFKCVRAVVPQMKQRGWGRIVNISSGAGRNASLTGIQAYASAKAGQIGFTRQMAHELGPFGITVNCVVPGFVLSNPATRQQWDGYGETGQAALVEGIALRRLGEPEDIANGVRFFASDAASYVTGQVLPVNGGRTLF
ncbi:MAG: short-chain dehydrogenase [Microbacteriaceae bacterium]|nr:short-chain dehydrogenase [Microbacteriaceae bacterium]